MRTRDEPVSLAATLLYDVGPILVIGLGDAAGSAHWTTVLETPID